MRIKTLILLSFGVMLLFQNCKNTNTKSNNTTTIKTDSVSIQSLNKQIEENPKKAELYASRAKLHGKTGELTKAIKDLTIANSLDSLNPTYYISLADFYIQLGNSGITASLLEKANRLIPDNTEILYRLGNLYFYVQDYRKSLYFLNETLTLDPYFPMAYFTKALLLLEKGDTATAVSNLQIAVEREPEYYDAYVQLGLLFAKKNSELALSYYNNALNLFPESYDALYGKAMYYQNNNMPIDAIETYQKIIEATDKNKHIIFYNIAYNYMLYIEEYKNAIQYYDSALSYQKQFPEALCNKAFCLEQLGEFNTARKNYQKALKQVPNYDIAIKGLNRLDKR